MKRLLLVFAFLATFPALNAQTYRLTVGDEMKIKKGTSDVDIIAADNTGIYVAENRLKSGWSFSPYDVETRLIKFNDRYQEVYAKDYDKELDDYTFHSFQTVGDDLFILAKGYEKKEKAFKVFAAKIDKETGKINGLFKELGTYNLEDKRDVYRLKTEPIEGGESLMLVSDISATEHTRLGIEVVNANLEKKHSVVINLAFTPGRYSVEDVKLLANNQVVLLGKEMQEVLDAKKKPSLVFKQFRVSLFDSKGAKIKDIAVEAGNRFMMSGKLIYSNNANELLLAGFYSNDATKAKLAGFFVSRLNNEKGEITVTTFKEITRPVAQITDSNARGEQFGNQFSIRTVEESPADGSYIITAEAFDYSTWMQQEMESRATGTVMRYYTWHRFTNADLLIINAEKNGDIRWLTTLPKTQIEEFRSTGSSVPFASRYTTYFAQGGGMPYYSSYKAMLQQDHLILLLNDHSENRGIQTEGTAKPVSDFVGKSSLYAVAIDMKSGKMTRKAVTANGEDLLLMPRHSYISNNDVIIPSMKGRVLAKTIFKLAKITVK